MQQSQITLKNIHKAFTVNGIPLPILRGISTSFERGKSYAIKGVSGTGKSTLLQLIAGLHKPCSGMVLYNTQPLHDYTDEQYRNFLSEQIGLVFQKPYLLGELSVMENVMLKGLIVQQAEKVCRERALYLLELVGLADKAHLQPTVLSGGEQQRVALARALLLEPKFLLLDEPTAHLDMRGRDHIIALCQELKKQAAVGIILSSHDAVVTGAMEKEFILHNGILL